MLLKDHLLYIDITNVCKVNCECCMYKDERKMPPRNLHLTPFARKSLSNLVNDPDTNHIIISGEGEPFNNERVLDEILRLSNGNRCFQIVTNGDWIDTDINDKLAKFESMAKELKDRYSIRISLDSFHAKRIDNSKYANLITAAAKNGLKHVSVAFRSLLEEKEFTRDLITRVAGRTNLPFCIEFDNLLDDEMFIDNSQINITYKNAVNPRVNGIENPVFFSDYIRALESKYHKIFTLGNLRTNGTYKGLDITIKPEGDVMFYGAEIGSFGNIFLENLTMQRFTETVNQNPVIRGLYSIPFEIILSELSKDSDINEMIKLVNNPYWMIKNLYPKYSKRLEEVINNLQ